MYGFWIPVCCLMGLEPARPARVASPDFCEKIKKHATFLPFPSQNLEKYCFSPKLKTCFRFFSEKIILFFPGMVSLEPARAVSRDFWEKFKNMLLFLVFLPFPSQNSTLFLQNSECVQIFLRNSLVFTGNGGFGAYQGSFPRFLGKIRYFPSFFFLFLAGKTMFSSKFRKKQSFSIFCYFFFKFVFRFCQTFSDFFHFFSRHFFESEIKQK